MARFGIIQLLLLTMILAVVFLLTMSPYTYHPTNYEFISGSFRTANVSGPEIVEAGEFAIQEQNRRANTNLGFRTIIRAESQVVGGMNYNLLVHAAHKKEIGDSDKYYQVLVYKKLPCYGGNKTLYSFTRLSTPSAFVSHCLMCGLFTWKEKDELQHHFLQWISGHFFLVRFRLS